MRIILYVRMYIRSGMSSIDMRAQSCTGRVAEMHRLGASSIAYAYTIVECSALVANMCRLEYVTFAVNHMLMVVPLMTKYHTHPAHMLDVSCWSSAL